MIHGYGNGTYYTKMSGYVAHHIFYIKMDETSKLASQNMSSTMGSIKFSQVYILVSSVVIVK
jgi:hypothetical protein